MYIDVVKSIKNNRLGGTPLNKAQGDTVSGMAEMPREPKRSLEYMVAGAWATITTGIAHLEGFDNELMQTGGTQITSVTQSLCS